SGRAVKKFQEESNVADAWIYSEGFTDDNLDKVRELDFVEDAQLRTEVRGTVPEYEGAQMDFYLMDESIILKPFLYEGAEGAENKLKEADSIPFDATDKDGVWLSWSFANAWEISVGDNIELEHNGLTFKRTVRGLIMEPEYEYCRAEKDADTNFKNIAYVYMGYDAFPIRDYVEKLINTEKITIKTIQDSLEENSETPQKSTESGELSDSLDSLEENSETAQKSTESGKLSDSLDDLEENLKAAGMTLDDVDKDMLLDFVDGMSDDDLMNMIPYTTMLVTLTDKAKEDAAKKLKEEKSDISVPLYYEKKIADSIDNNYAVMIDKDSVLGIKRVDDELKQHDTFSYAFAIIFLVVAVLVISTTMSRLVERQRTQIGTLNAMGMKRSKITLHYISYSFLVSAIGAVAGLIVGPITLGDLIIDMIMTWYMVPNVSAGSNAMFYGIAALVICACVLASFFSCRKLLKVPPAAALRPAAPKKAKRILAERLPIWDRLGFSTQYNLRDVTRAPMRVIMGIVGSMLGTILVIYAFGCYILVDDIVEWNFDKIMNYNYQMVLSEDENVAYFDKIADDVNGEMIMSDSIELSAKKNPTALEKSKQTITVIEGKGFHNVTDEMTDITNLVPGKVAISCRLSKKMGLKVGDKVYWHIYSKNDWYESEIGLINRTPDTAGIMMLREDLEKTGCEYKPTTIVTKKDVRDYEGVKGISAVYSMSKIKKAFVDGYAVIKYLFYMMMIFSIVTIVVVLYNSGNLSFHERLKEFATLKVMGLSTAKIRRILNQENIWFAVIGIIIGCPFGKPTLLAMMNSNGENFDYYVRVPAYLYVLSGLFVLLVAMVVSVMFSRKIKRLDMVETLKGLE
nr:ABC transporter permease [Lachnospiraceae bacterium]